jgi:murein DD-endopeptidase MepM/ murein hydrolase activator NlpD
MKKVAVILVAVFILVTGTITINAETDNKNINDAIKERQKIKEEINSVNQDKEDNQNEAKEYEETEKKLEDEENEKEKEIFLLSSEIIKADKELSNLKVKIKQAENEYEDQMDSFSKRFLVMYQNSEMSYVDLFVKSKTIFDFYRKIDIMAKVVKRDKQLIKNLNLTKKEIEYNKDLQEQLKKEKEEKAIDVKESLENVLDSKEDVKIELNKRMSTIDLLEKMEIELEKESLNIENSIKAMELKGEYIGGEMNWPVPSSNTITSKYGYRIHPIYNTKRMHTGIDVSGDYGASIVAANDGEVIFSSWQGGYGNTILISHGGKIVTLYGHCSELVANVGQKVKAGEVVAKVGSTGASTGNHLHFEVRVNGSPTDPMEYLLPK